MNPQWYDLRGSHLGLTACLLAAQGGEAGDLVSSSTKKTCGIGSDKCK